MEGAAPAPGAAREVAGGGTGPRAGEALMDQYLSSQGLYRKKIAKDGSCLFRAVAEQVLHSQARHYDIRIDCINYLRENRNNFEAFIEGQFEEYLKRLENPQEWVGQVEISALSLMYKKDFVIYQEPNAPPSCVTENQFPDKIMLCFSNGNHYDIVYPATYPDSAALCQSIIYEMLYEKVFSTDVGKTLLELDNHDGTKEENCVSDEESESDTEDPPRNKNTNSSNMNGFKSHSGKKQLHNNGDSTYLFLSRKVIHSLNPALYRNVEYDVWLNLKRDQQKRDFSIAAGMQYSVGDKCKVRLEPSGKFYDAHIQDVSSENGPVVVFIHEFGKKYDVPLKSLKPIPQGTAQSVPREAWNTVSGKKIKRSSFGSEAEYRGQKTPGKPVKPQSTLPPRLQQAAGNRQQHYSTLPGPASQHIPIEHRNLNRTSTQATGSRKLEREKSEEVDYYSKDCNYFGLSPEERRERKAIEESRSLYEMQHRDEQAFPALSSQVQTGEFCNQRKLLNANNEKTPKQKLGLDECKDSNSETNHPNQSEPTVTVEVRQKECLQTTATSVATSSVVTPSCANPAPLEILPEPELSVLPVVPPVVPSIPDTLPAWPNEPAAYSATGIATQMSASPVIPVPSGAPEPAMAQAHGPSAQFSSLPVPLQAVNPPMMPLPPTMNPYQDPLYPGFPVDENGERGTVPPYSLCKGGDDLPEDKGILRFFFNLGLKAYSCPMWAPHSYLYPLHQMYLNICRMYPKVPVYPQNTWFQEVGSTDIEHSPHANLHSPMQNESRINSPRSLGAVATSPPPPPPWFVSTVQIPSNAGPTPNMCGIEAIENVLQPAPAIYADSPVNKSIYPQQALGHSSFLGPVPVAHSFYPPVWYGYPMQSFVESPNMQHTVVASDTQCDRNKEYNSPVLEQNMEQFHEDNAVNPSTEQAPVTSVGSELPHNGTAMQAPKCKPMQAPRSKPMQAPKSKTLLTTTPNPPKRAGLPDVSIEAKEIDRHVVVPNPSQENVALSELAKTTVSSNEKKEMHEDPKAPVGLQSAVLQSRIHRTRDESSEDEREVSDMLRSGRSKNFYNQTYGARKYRSDRGYAPNRGGFHYHRNDEGWKGQSSRNREDGYQPYRGFRGRPYKSENRRRPTSDLYRGHQDHDSHGQYQKPN